MLSYCNHNVIIVHAYVRLCASLFVTFVDGLYTSTSQVIAVLQDLDKRFLEAMQRHDNACPHTEDAGRIGKPVCFLRGEAATWGNAPQRNAMSAGNIAFAPACLSVCLFVCLFPHVLSCFSFFLISWLRTLAVCRK